MQESLPRRRTRQGNLIARLEALDFKTRREAVPMRKTPEQILVPKPEASLLAAGGRAAQRRHHRRPMHKLSPASLRGCQRRGGISW